MTKKNFALTSILLIILVIIISIGLDISKAAALAELRLKSTELNSVANLKRLEVLGNRRLVLGQVRGSVLLKDVVLDLGEPETVNRALNLLDV